MTREEAVTRLVAHQQELQARGVKSLALFGSVARGDADRSSDVDVVVELDRPVSLFGLSDIKHMIQTILAAEKVDLITRDGIHPALKDIIFLEAVDVI
ncbi:MAG: nucleotidyltransferase family protein [Desulfomonilaceae bacterium]|nr:nucleotidyltransferase family protein [Desulfomonilaceae bacterium]